LKKSYVKELPAVTESNFLLLCARDMKNGRQDQQVEFSAPNNQTR